VSLKANSVHFKSGTVETQPLSLVKIVTKLHPFYDSLRLSVCVNTTFIRTLFYTVSTGIFDVNKKVQLDATVCRHLFTAQSLYMFRVSQHPSSGVLKTVSATSGIGHDTGTATSFQRGLVPTRPRWKEVAVPVS